MDYKEYYETYYNYRQAKNKLHKIQNDIADIITGLLSTASQMKDVVTNSSNANDKMLELTAKKIELEAKEELAKELLKIREKQKNDDEKELRKSVEKSKDIKDTVYIKYFIDYIKPKTIAMQLSYSTSYIYDILSQIREYIANYDKKRKKT